jgi:hypothetical protein
MRDFRLQHMHCLLHQCIAYWQKSSKVTRLGRCPNLLESNELSTIKYYIPTIIWLFSLVCARMLVGKLLPSALGTVTQLYSYPYFVKRVKDVVHNPIVSPRHSYMRVHRGVKLQPKAQARSYGNQ